MFATICSSSVGAIEVSEITSAVRNGQAKLNFRYRYEYVDEDGFTREARASTLRSRMTWESAMVQRWSIGAEVDHVAVVGGERYHSLANGRASYPVVADPDGLDLNQSYVRYQSKSVTVTAGRQRIAHSNQRILGSVPWRQNEQTYDALRFEIRPSERVVLDYGYLWNVNRLFGPDDGIQPSEWDSNSHAFHATYVASERHHFRAFSYWVDFDNDNGPINSNVTHGVAYQGTFGALGIAATAAMQSDYGANPLNYRAPYYAIETDYSAGPIDLRLAFEVLGSDDGRAGFRTPLATLHKFQGSADKFVATPPDGVQDLSLGVSTTLGDIALSAVWHRFTAHEGNGVYGHEVNLVADIPVHDNVSLQIKYADYSADEFALDTKKAWLMLIVDL